MPRNRFAPVIVAILAMLVFLGLLRFPMPVPGIDFYPLYLGAQLAGRGEPAYGPDAVALLRATWVTPWPSYAEAGIAYPLPLLWLIIPFTALPYPLALGLWVVLGCGLLASVRTLPSHAPWLILLAFWPIPRTILLGQATLVWAGLAALMVAGVVRRQPWAVVLVVPLLFLKPQNGAIFALAGAFWLWREHPRKLLYSAAIGAGMLVLSLVVAPEWIGAWLEQVRTYQRIVQLDSLLPVGLLLPVACLRLPWWAKIAALQTIMFPISDPYGLAPLIFVWLAIGGWPAVIGAALSWFWPILLPPELTGDWLFMLLPLIVVAALRSLQLGRVETQRLATASS